MIALYMDENVPFAVTLGHRRRGVDVVTVQEDGRRGAPDPAVLDRAAALARVVFTNDEDFLAEAARRQRAGETFMGVIYIHQEKLIVGPCIDDLELIAKANTLDEYSDFVQYLPL